MINKMTDVQLSTLQSSAAHPDRLLEPPANVRSAAAKAFVRKLVDAGWVKEVKTQNGALAWRTDAASGQANALKLTAKGLKSIAAIKADQRRRGAVGLKCRRFRAAVAGKGADASRRGDSRNSYEQMPR